MIIWRCEDITKYTWNHVDKEGRHHHFLLYNDTFQHSLRAYHTIDNGPAAYLGFKPYGADTDIGTKDKALFHDFHRAFRAYTQEIETILKEYN